MKRSRVLSILSIILPIISIMPVQAQDVRETINLNGTWDFDQTADAFPPKKFTRTCPVPGLIHLARPAIDQYSIFFRKPEESTQADSHDLSKRDYMPKYSWYRKRVFVPGNLEGREAVLTLKKSQYVTQVYVNSIDMGSSMSCYTPIDMNITRALKYGNDNEILVRVGDRAWLPSEAAGGTDKEKIHYLPGIWDDVMMTFSGKVRIHRMLVLPSVRDRKVTVKMQIRSYFPPQMLYGNQMTDTCTLHAEIVDPIDGTRIAEASLTAEIRRDNITRLDLEIPVQDMVAWTPDHPRLYIARVSVAEGAVGLDEISDKFGYRDFGKAGKHFYLNGSRIYLRGTNITLQRFFEDPDCSDLVWDRDWVRKMLIDIPKKLQWNAMRICVGIVPDFWYDLADEYGIMFQNEWLYWQNHGWDDQIRKEYTDWVWSDGDHPSIVIWDAINENWDPFIGNVLIPDLKKLDPTRIWDAGYMTADDMPVDEMDEPHPYRAGWAGMVADDLDAYFDKNPYFLGDLDDWPQEMQKFRDAGSPQLVNEYGWIWLWRNGKPAKLTKRIYDYLLGPDATPDQRRRMQAYWLQLETEWLRSERSFAGILSFCYLANNYGFTGDWFINNIKDLEEGPTLRWFRHCFAPQAVFIDLPDQRYLKTVNPYQPGRKLTLNLAGINDLDKNSTGTVSLEIIDPGGQRSILYTGNISTPPYGKTLVPISIQLPEKPGGYLMVTTFSNGSDPDQVSRRYIVVGREVPFTEFAEISP